MEEEVDNVGEGGRWPRVSKDWSGLSNSEEMSRPELLRLPMGEPCIPEESTRRQPLSGDWARDALGRRGHGVYKPPLGLHT